MFKHQTLLALIFAVICGLALTGCGNVASNTAPAAKLKVATSVYPVYEFTRQVGRDKVEVAMLVPPGVEPHDWEPTAKEIMQLKTAKLFLYHGAGFESLDKLLTPETLGDTRAVAVSAGIPELTAHEGVNAEEHHDSHIWLDPVYAQQEVTNIAEALAAADPQNSAFYRTNAADYKAQLAQLDAEYQKVLSTAARREIITSHAAFGYLAKRYNLKQIAIMGLAPDSEPTPEKMAKVISFCREHEVKYIFFETIVNPKLSETIAQETGAGLLVLNPVENLTSEQFSQGASYLSLMRDNLANLQKALN